MLPYGSASALPLFMKCTAAAVLPHVDHDLDRARECSAIHEHLQLRSSHGVDEAMLAMPRIAAKWELNDDQAKRVVAECRAFEWSPPAGSLGEVALCYLRDGNVARVVGGQGKYALPDGGLIPGTSDLIWCELDGQPVPFEWETPEQPICPEGAVLWCTDYKAGQDRYVAPIEWNAQALFNTRNAARWTRAKYAVPAVLFVRAGKGDWDVPVDSAGNARVLGPRDLDELDRSIAGFISDVDEQRRKFLAGEPLDYVEGRHCTFCSAQWKCDAKVSLMQRVAGRSVHLPRAGEPLDPSTAAWLAERVGFFEMFAERAREVLREHAENAGPIVMSDGDAWGRIPGTKIVIDGKRALSILRDEIGGGDATPITELGDQVSKNALFKTIEESVRVRRYGNARHIYGRALRRLEEDGAVREVEKNEFGVFRPKPTRTTTTGLVVEDLDGGLVL
jgi:hypothetical protein